MFYDVFISYSQKEQAYALRLFEELSSRGFNVWIDTHSLLGGDMWEEITEGLKASCAYVVIMSQSALKSESVQYELSLAKKEEKRPFPLVLEGDIDTFRLKNPTLHWLFRYRAFDVTDGHLPSERFFDGLKDAVSKCRQASHISNSVSHREQSRFYKLAWDYFTRNEIVDHDEKRFSASSRTSISLWRDCIIDAKQWEALSYAPDLWENHEQEISQAHQNSLIQAQAANNGGLSRIFIFDSLDDCRIFYTTKKEVTEANARWLLKDKLLAELKNEIDEQDMMLDFAIANKDDYVLWFQLNERTKTLEVATLTIENNKLTSARKIFQTALRWSKPFSEIPPS